MTVLALNWNADQQIAELIEAEDTLANWLHSAVIMSLFTDARASADEQPNLRQRRGYWGDIELDGDTSLGSKLWLHQRSKLTRQTVLQVQETAQQALDWLVEDGHVAAVRVVAERQPPERLAFLVELTLLDNQTLNMNLSATTNAAYATTGEAL